MTWWRRLVALSVAASFASAFLGGVSSALVSPIYAYDVTSHGYDTPALLSTSNATSA